MRVRETENNRYAEEKRIERERERERERDYDPWCLSTFNTGRWHASSLAGKASEF